MSKSKKNVQEQAPPRIPPISMAIANVKAELGPIGKKHRDDRGIAYRKGDDVIDAIAPLLVKHQIITVPETLEVQVANVEVGKNRANMRFINVRVKYTFIGPAGDSLQAVTPGEAMDSGDRATAKAMSVAYRTVLTQMFTISTSGDPATSPAPAAPKELPPLSQADRKKVEIIQWARTRKVDTTVLAQEYKSFTSGKGSFKTDQDVKLLQSFFEHICSAFVEQKQDEHAAAGKPSSAAAKEEHQESAGDTGPQFIGDLLDQLGETDRGEQFKLISEAVGRQVIRTAELTADDLKTVHKYLEELVEARRQNQDDPKSDVAGEVLDVTTGEAESPAVLVTPEISWEIKAKVEQIGLSAYGRNKFLMATTPSKSLGYAGFTDDDWLKVSQRTDRVLQAEEELPQEWFVKEAA